MYEDPLAFFTVKSTFKAAVSASAFKESVKALAPSSEPIPKPPLFKTPPRPSAQTHSSPSAENPSALDEDPSALDEDPSALDEDPSAFKEPAI